MDDDDTHDDVLNNTATMETADDTIIMDSCVDGRAAIETAVLVDLSGDAAQKNSVCDTETHDGPVGLKKRSAEAIQKTTMKRVCNRKGEVTTQMINNLHPNLAPEDVHDVLQDYNYALRILKSRNDSMKDSNPSLEYMIGLINDWKPRREIICMYVRWSKRLRRNFHLDSISTLLCVAKQCDYKPYVFLKNIKTLTVTRSTTSYGMTFKFDTRNNKSIDGKKLSDKFLGLSITLRLLQRAVVSSSGTFGRIGLKSNTRSAEENGDNINLTTRSRDEEGNVVIAEKPTSRFHTKDGLTGRIWLAIQHRWIALQVVEILYPTQLANSRSEEESLAFSFQMHSSSGPSRFDFLEPLIGVCMRYRSTTIIDHHTSVLQSVWENPSTFVAFGCRLLQNILENEQIQCILETFHSLQSMIENVKNITIHRKTEREIRWQMVRGYALHFWLEREQNQGLKSIVERLCKKQIGSMPREMPSPTKRCVPKAHPKFGPSVELERIQKEKILPLLHQNDRETLMLPVGVCHGGYNSGGLSQLLKSRQQRATTASLDQAQPRGGSESTTHKSSSLRSYTQDEQHRPRSQGHISAASVSPIDPTIFPWASVRLATQDEILSRITSRLLIHRDDGITLVEELSPLEVYSANMLYRLRHSRQTRKENEVSAKTDVGDVVLTIGADVAQFIDQPSKLFHVAREESMYFKEHGHLMPSILQVCNLCRAVFKYGRMDTTRSAKQFRVNIGCGGQHRPNGIPETLIGLQFKNKLDADTGFDAEEVIRTIGVMTAFTWNILKDIQVTASDIPLAPDLSRRRHYASHLARYLNMDEDVGFEDVTVVVGVLYPLMPSVTEHVDSMNDSVAGYTRTGALNMVLAMGQETDTVLLHVQVLCNFRKVIREYLFPFQTLLSSIVFNCKTYLAKWQCNMNQIYGGKTQQLPSPFDRTNIFMDDCLSFATLDISGGSQTVQKITGEYLLTEISPSRVLSFSMFIDPIVDLRESLCYDQLMELCFVASLLSNPFWFEYSMTVLTRKHLNNTDPFHFGLHPMYDWTKETISNFGTWQGGPHNRWSPCGGTIPFPVLFGAHASASKLDQDIGRTRLIQVMQILYHHLQWVNSLKGVMEDVTHDLPLSTVEFHMTSITEAIYKIVPCQFNVFRLMVFTTISAGCGMIEEGVHLKAIIYPVKGSASFKHLTNTDQDRMTRIRALALCGEHVEVPDVNVPEQKGIESQRHDQLLLYVSHELGMTKYLRDETECVLCESHPNRNLKCRDWFKKGRRIYDLDHEGNVLQREYGSETQWIKMRVPSMKHFAYLNEIIVYEEIDATTKAYVSGFYDCLERNKHIIKFRESDRSVSEFVEEHNIRDMCEMAQPFPMIKFRVANFVNPENIEQRHIAGKPEYDDGNVVAKLKQECNNVMDYPEGLCLWRYIEKVIHGCMDADDWIECIVRDTINIEKNR